MSFSGILSLPILSAIVDIFPEPVNISTTVILQYCQNYYRVITSSAVTFCNWQHTTDTALVDILANKKIIEVYQADLRQRAANQIDVIKVHDLMLRNPKENNHF